MDLGRNLGERRRREGGGGGLANGRSHLDSSVAVECRVSLAGVHGRRSPSLVTRVRP